MVKIAVQLNLCQQDTSLLRTTFVILKGLQNRDILSIILQETFKFGSITKSFLGKLLGNVMAALSISYMVVILITGEGGLTIFRAFYQHTRMNNTYRIQ
jgi:hypothetical protein